MDLSDSDSADPLSPYSRSDDSLSTSPAEYHAKPSLRWVTILGIIESTFMFASPFLIASTAPEPKPSIWPFVVIGWLMALFLGYITACMAFDLKFGVIRADETGLSWRRPFSGPKSARWEEITDYYRGLSTSRVVVTPVGKLELSSTYEGIERIADLVIEKTPHLNKLGWEMKGTRSNENWSRTFSPWSGEQLWAAPSMTGIVVLMVFGWLIAPVTSENRNQAPLGFWLDTFPLIVVTLFGALLVGGYIWMIRHLWRNWLFASKHRDEKLVLDAKGLAFSSNTRHFAAKWQEIEKISLLPKVNGITPVQVETAIENFVIWNIAERPLWRRIELIINQYAAHAMQEQEVKIQKSRQRENDLQGESGAWSGGVIGMGARRWSFRAAGTRFVLQITSFVLLFLPVFYPVSAYNHIADQPVSISWSLFAGLYIVSVLIITAQWFWYYRSEILADEHGLQIRSPFHPTHKAAWQDIEGLGTDAWGGFVRTKQRKFYFERVFPPVRVEELRAHIESHLHNPH